MNPQIAEAAPISRELNELVAQERAAREQAGKTANDLARLVAQEMRRADLEAELREEAEKTARGMAALVAQEHARAEDAEQLLRELGWRR